jgi:hypothetical protein
MRSLAREKSATFEERATFEARELAPSATKASGRTTQRAKKDAFLIAALCSCAGLCGCSQSGGSAAAAPPPPPPPAAVQVNVVPQNVSVILGNTQAFTALVTNSPDTTVTWSVNGIPGGNPPTGTITSAGLYTAPADLPTPASVQITAISVADPAKVGAASLTISSDIALQVAPNVAAVELGALQPFSASVVSSGHPDTTLRWSVSGSACPGACGSVDAHGSFTAPQILPLPAAVTVTAQSVADPSKQASTTVTVTSNFALTISAPASVPANASAAIVATLASTPGSNPSQLLSWLLSGTGCSGSACGTLTTITTQSIGGSKLSNSATYTAPGTAPTPNTVVISVTPQADPSKAAQVTLAIAQGVGVSITPATATLADNHRITLSPQVNGSANGNVLWTVNGVADGNPAVGQICIQGSNPCQAVLSASSAPVDYLAPGAIPTPNPVTVQAISAADATKTATTQITVLNHVLVSVLPSSATLAPGAVQAFTAMVLGTSNQQVVWQISGTECATTGGVCGAIDASGTYTAPPVPPTPNTLQVIAVSQDDGTQSGVANVMISTGVNILSLHPASVYAGAAQGFSLRVDGSGFAAPGSGSGTGAVLMIAGNARPTTCASATECLAPVVAGDVSLAGNVSVQVRNPNGTQSNVVDLVVAQPNRSDASIALTSANPEAVGQDIVLVEPTTAGVSTPDDRVDLDVAALGAFSATTNACTLAGNSLTLSRPASGNATADLCLFAESGLDTSMTVTISGPGDVSVIAEQPAGLGILHVTLLLPAGAAPGPRTLFIQNTNLDKTAATGAVNIQ